MFSALLHRRCRFKVHSKTNNFIPVNNPHLYDKLIQKGHDGMCPPVVNSKHAPVPGTREFDDLLDTANLNQVMEEFSGSGSGAGLPLLVQRTLARQIRLVEIIGKGRFGEVWLGTWHDDPVAVKIFSARDERSWFRETEIYQTALIRHANILGFIAADNIDTGAWTQLWLVTDYYPDGSLYDYLVKHVVTVETMLIMLTSIATGLNHLHIQIDGCEDKPAIAHRDLKSKNILVKPDYTCCIADFGLAVKHDARNNKIDILPNSKAGTNRYMSPECLQGKLNVNSFDSFKQSDVYSLSLVMWEVCFRCDANNAGNVPGYCPPYGEYTNADPSFEEIREVVCAKKLRPTIETTWFQHPIIGKVVRLMKESWYDEPAARLSALRIKKTLNFVLTEQRSDFGVGANRILV
ncbi:hypothetical protein ACOME3_002162 [Neoechinorhynchus agilis]